MSTKDAFDNHQDLLDEVKVNYETDPNEISLSHGHNYMSGYYKGRGRVGAARDAESFKQRVVYSNPGRAMSLKVVPKPKDPRIGAHPQHNSPGGFNPALEPRQAIGFEEFEDLFDIAELEKHGYKRTIGSITKKKLQMVQEQFAHLHYQAFRQMMAIVKGFKRDYDVWIKYDKESNETKVAFPHPEIELVQFMQIVKKNHEGEVISLKHIMFDAGEPLVINETSIDKAGIVRQIAHVGCKDQHSTTRNALERFDDGFVVWTSTNEKGESGTSALSPDGEIFLISNKDSEMTKFTARNLGGEGVGADGKWTGDFCPKACTKDDKSPQREYKEAVRKQIYQIVDGASLPGLTPIFTIHNK